VVLLWERRERGKPEEKDRLSVGGRGMKITEFGPGEPSRLDSSKECVNRGAICGI